MADPDLFDRRFVKPTTCWCRSSLARRCCTSRGHFGLNEVGRAVWKELMTGIPVRQAYEHLLTEFDVPPETLQQDLTSLLHDLLSQGLLEDARA
jgi:hypothetical protein